MAEFPPVDGRLQHSYLFALTAWILQASSQPSSNESESLQCYLCLFPFCLSKGKREPLQTLWGRKTPVSHFWPGKRPSIPTLTRSGMPPPRCSPLGVGIECHCCLLGCDGLILKHHERIWSLGVQSSFGEGGNPVPSLAPLTCSSLRV